MKNTSIDIAEPYALDLRRRLRSEDRFSDLAIFRGLDLVKTPFSSVSASLSRVTRPDQRLPLACLDRFDFVRRRVMHGNAEPAHGVPHLAWVCHAAKIHEAQDRLQ